MCIDLFWNSIY